MFFVLLGLSEGPKHGLGIAQEVGEQTGGSTQLGPGSLYTALKKALRDDLVEEAEAPDGEGDDPRRRYYRLTPLGRTSLSEEARRLASIVSVARDLRLLDEGAQ